MRGNVTRHASADNVGLQCVPWAAVVAGTHFSIGKGKGALVLK